ncbi:unnamed protein product [Closterium sp. NIES-53]
MDTKMASWKSTGTYVDEVPPPGANIVDGMWIFRVKQSSGSPPAFKARYVARGFSQREGVEFFQTFCPTPKMTTLRVLLHVATQCDYEMHSLDFSTAFLQGSLHEAILTTLAALGFAPSTADPSLFLRTETSLPLLYVLVYIVDLVFVTDYTEALALVKAKLQERRTCTDLGELRSYLGFQITRDRAHRTITLTQSHMVQQDQRLEHRTKHIALRYFLTVELQQHGQLRLAYVATQANTADVFTKALGSGDHQSFCTALGLVPTLPHLLVP